MPGGGCSGCVVVVWWQHSQLLSDSLPSNASVSLIVGFRVVGPDLHRLPRLALGAHAPAGLAASAWLAISGPGLNRSAPAYMGGGMGSALGTGGDVDCWREGSGVGAHVVLLVASCCSIIFIDW